MIKHIPSIIAVISAINYQSLGIILVLFVMSFVYKQCVRNCIIVPTLAAVWLWSGGRSPGLVRVMILFFPFSAPGLYLSCGMTTS